MSGSGVVPPSFGGQMGEQLGGVPDPHPVVRVRPRHAVLAVLMRLGLRNGRFLGSGHSRHRSATRRLAASFSALAVLIAGLAFGPVGAQPAAGTEEEDVTFTVALLNEVDSFNPWLGIEAESFEMWALTYDYMISYSMEDMSPEPGLATEWETSDDGLTWTFTIRDDVKWSDGEQLTAEDIAFTYNRILDGGPEAATWSGYLKSVETVEAPDPTTVVLTLEQPNAVLPLLPIPIIPEHVWSDISEADVKSYSVEPSDDEPVVGSGPFRFVEGTAGGSTYVFEANPDYWKGAPHIDRVVFKVYKSEDPAVQALIKGEVDFVEGITPLQVRSLEGQDGITAHSGDSPGFDEIAFNVGSIDVDTGEPIGDPNPAVLDPAFRRALNQAVDRELIIEKAYQGAGQPGTTIIPPAYDTYHWEPEDESAFAFDLDMAGEMLDEAGYELGGDGLRTMPDGSAIGKLRLFARTESETSLDVMDYFKEWLGELGIESEVNAVESNKLTNIILDGEFDVFEWGWYVEPDPDSMLQYLTCDQLANWNDTWYCSEEYDALYDQQNAEQDPEARAELVRQMQELLYEDAPYLVTAYSSIGEALRTDRFSCFTPQPNPGGIWLFQYGVHNYLNMRPASEADECEGGENTVGATDASTSEDASTSTILIVGGVVLVLLFVGGGIVMVRRRSSSGDRE